MSTGFEISQNAAIKNQVTDQETGLMDAVAQDKISSDLKGVLTVTKKTQAIDMATTNIAKTSKQNIKNAQTMQSELRSVS